MKRVAVLLGTWAVQPDAVLESQVWLNLRTRTVQRGWLTVHLSPMRMRLAAILLSLRGGAISMREIVDVMYGDREDGGPLGAHRTMSQFILALRRALAPLGLTIPRGCYGETGYYIEAGPMPAEPLALAA